MPEDNVLVEMPDGAARFNDRNEWGLFEIGSRTPVSEIEGEPESYPCIGFQVYYVHEHDRRDKQVYAFIYPVV